MSPHRAITASSLLAAFAVMTAPAPALHARAKTNQKESAQEFVREVIRNEISRQTDGTPVYWRYWEIDVQNGARKLFAIYQTKAGTVKRLVAVNGEPLPPAQLRQQEALLQRELHHPRLVRQAAKARSQDGQKERKLLAMLPNAFIFHYDGYAGDLVRLNFQPNPNFVPPTREAQVFHHMAGHLLVDPRQMRLAEIDGRLVTEVKFWWGMLGYLDQGGTFVVRQKDVGGGNWQMTRLVVNMNGKALFFKTIGVQENERFRGYRENPPDLTLRQAINRLENVTLPRQFAAR